MSTHESSIEVKNLIDYKLSTALTIDSVEDLAHELKKHLAQNKHNPNLSLDASAVEVITTPGVQMIIALGKLLERHNGALAINNPTEIFIKAFETLGLAQLLQKWGGSNG